MSPSICLIGPLVIWFVVAMVFYWYSIWRQNRKTQESMEVRFSLREGETILAVMDTAELTCFCIGTIEKHVHDEEDTIE